MFFCICDKLEIIVFVSGILCRRGAAGCQYFGAALTLANATPVTSNTQCSPPLPPPASPNTPVRLSAAVLDCLHFQETP